KGNTGVSLTLNYGEPSGDRTDTELKLGDIRALTNYTWATKVKITVRRVPEPNSTDFLKTTYSLIGTDEAGKNLLEDAWSHITDSTRLYLLYGMNSDGLTSQTLRECFLLKTNLSTDRNTSPTAMAMMVAAETAPRFYYASLIKPDSMSNQDFQSEMANGIKLIWECSTVNSGGYYLRYAEGSADNPTGLPDAIFTDGQTTSLTLLILPQQPGTPPPLAQPFHNSLVLWQTDTVDLTTGALYLEAPDTEKVLHIPPRNIGFRLERPRVEAKDDGKAEDDLQALYHLLNYQVQPTPSVFSASQEGLPIGPLADDPTTTADDDLWSYERVVPINDFAVDRGMTDKPNLPRISANPYAGVGQQATLTFLWQDVYGNQLSKTAQSKAISLRYFDRLLGINQWPSVAASYTFTLNDDDKLPYLNLELLFDQTRYLAVGGQSLTTALENIRTARATYEQVYYQIHQKDVGFTVQTSVLPQGLPATTGTFQGAAKQWLTDFVESAYRYLSTLTHLQSYQHGVIENDTLQTLSNTYHVSLKALAEANQKLPSLFATQTLLAIPVDHKVTATEATQSLGKIVSAETKKATLTDDQFADRLSHHLKYIAANNADMVILKPDRAISITAPHSDTVSYTVKANDTFHRIALQYISITQATATDLLVPNVKIKIGILSYTIKANDTLATLATTAGRGILDILDIVLASQGASDRLRTLLQ
ncbi:MAG: LysM peptidoglycan-binding domain-containing protein, partial [Kovacikia sp.]